MPNLEQQLRPDAVPRPHPDWHLHWASDNSFLLNRIDQNRIAINDSTALIWSLCDGKRTLGSIADSLVALYPQDADAAIDGLCEVVNNQLDQGLMLGQLRVSTVSTATPVGPKRKLCIGMATFDDYDGVYFSVQAIRMYHPEVTDETEILVVDNNPRGNCAKALKQLDSHVDGYRYIPYSERSSTAVRDLVFREANADYVLCIDCHVFLVPGAIRKLIDWFDANPDNRDLLQGPLLHDDLKSVSTHMEPIWRDGMFGAWGGGEQGEDPDAEPFEIPMQGAGLFACRKDAWLGFNPRFSRFGGEEGYIHEKYRQAGRRTLCLPFLRWMHRFNRPLGMPYQADWASRIRNYLIGADELGTNPESVIAHFESHLEGNYTRRYVDSIEQEIAAPLYYFDAVYHIRLPHTLGKESNPDFSDAQQQLSNLNIEKRAIGYPEQITLSPDPVDLPLAHHSIVASAARHGLQHVLVIEDLPRLAAIDLTTLQSDTLPGLGNKKWAAIMFVVPADQLSGSPSETVVAVAYHSRGYAKLLNEIPVDLEGYDNWSDGRATPVCLLRTLFGSAVYIYQCESTCRANPRGRSIPG